jgi:hypothetical protein
MFTNICLIIRNVRNKRFSNSVSQLIYSIPDASSVEEVYNILEMIKNIKEPGIEGNFLIFVI